MTTAGIITMLCSITFVWSLFIFCCIKLVKNKSKNSA